MCSRRSRGGRRDGNAPNVACGESRKLTGGCVPSPGAGNGEIAAPDRGRRFRTVSESSLRCSAALTISPAL